MAHILALTGSPSPTSRTERLLAQVGTRLRAAEGHEVRHLAVRDLPPEPLLAGDPTHPAIREAVGAVAAADAVVVGTPVYKAAYSGLLKVFLDLLPQTALRDKQVLPLVTGGSVAHVLALDYALRPVLNALGARHVLRGRFVLDAHIARDVPDRRLPGDGGVQLTAEAQVGVAEAVAELVEALAAVRRPRESTAAAVAV